VARSDLTIEHAIVERDLRRAGQEGAVNRIRAAPFPCPHAHLEALVSRASVPALDTGLPF
jgi:hypothetical protein